MICVKLTVLAIGCASHSTRLDAIAPDICLRDVDLVDYESIRIENEIGSGGYAIVYKGKLPTGELVAVKSLTFEKEKDILGKEQIREKLREFRREVTVMKYDDRFSGLPLGCFRLRERESRKRNF